MATATPELKDGIATFYAKDEKTWRNWLTKHHQTATSIWLIIYKKESGVPSVYYPEAVNQALCFGWIDSKPNKRDANSYYQFFAKRNPKSNWSKVNKTKVAHLMTAGLMHHSGLAMVELAKTTGTWEALDNVEQLQIPTDLEAALQKNKKAYQYFLSFSPSSRRGILEWLLNAKKAETRLKRITEIVDLAAQNKKANHPTAKQ